MNYEKAIKPTDFSAVAPSG